MSTQRSARERKAGTRVIQAAIAAAQPQQFVAEYFAGPDGEWEAEMRQGFAELRRRLANPTASLARLHLEMLMMVNAKYRTRFPSEQLSAASQAILKVIKGRNWPGRTPPTLLVDTSAAGLEVTETVRRAIRAVHSACEKRPYSLTTKFLHFCYPDTFPIYDSRAAASVECWSYFAFGNSNPPHFRRWAMMETDGGGYKAIVSFYQSVWRSCPQGQQRKARKSVSDLEKRLSARFHKADAEISVLDLIDKLIWKADGNPFKLGLVDEEQWESG